MWLMNENLVQMFKCWFRLCVPPIIVLAINRRKNYTFSGFYEHINDIALKKNRIYNDDYILNLLCQEAEKRLSGLNSSALIEGDEGRDPTVKLLPLIILWLTMTMNKKIKICDFGGGLGNGYLNSKTSLGHNVSFEFHIIETRKMKEIGERVFRDEKDIFFHDSIFEENFDLINVGSVLQYMADYKETILRLCALKGKYFLFTNHYMTLSDTFATLQKNMQNTESGYWILSFPELVDIMRQNDYELIYRSNDKQGHTFGDIPKEKIEILPNSTCNLLFYRKNNLSNGVL